MTATAVFLYTALAGVGAGALSCALASSLFFAALVAGSKGPGWVSVVMPLAGSVLGFAWAVVLMVWAVRCLRSGHAPWLRRGVKVLAVAAGLHLATVLVGVWQLPLEARYFDLNAACAALLELSMLCCLGWLRRQGPAQSAIVSETTAQPSPSEVGSVHAGRLLAAVFAGSLLVAGITTPGLAASTAGAFAIPHSEHGAHHSTTPDTGLLNELEHQGHHH